MIYRDDFEHINKEDLNFEGWLGWENGVTMGFDISDTRKLPVYNLTVTSESTKTISLIVNDYGQCILPQEVKNYLRLEYGFRTVDIIHAGSDDYISRDYARNFAIVSSDGDIYEGDYHSEIVVSYSLEDTTNLICASYCNANEYFLESFSEESLLYLPLPHDYIYINAIDTVLTAEECVNELGTTYGDIAIYYKQGVSHE